MSKKQSKKTPSSKKNARAQTTSAAAAKPAKAKHARRVAPADSGATTADGASVAWQPNPRLPPAGTTIAKRDRHGAVRCECTVEDGGIRYAGSLYPSISAAAMAAATDLGLKNKTQNGFTFWGLTKPPRAPSDPIEALTAAWDRFEGKVSAVVTDGITDENRTKVSAALRKQLQGLERFCEQVA
jgi:hypothetical protein